MGVGNLEWQGSEGVPLFVLDAWVHGLTGEVAVHAFAERMLKAIAGGDEVHAFAYPSEFQPGSEKV
jgi:hypothetical protein